jgi:hypothetical protein
MGKDGPPRRLTRRGIQPLGLNHATYGANSIAVNITVGLLDFCKALAKADDSVRRGFSIYRKSSGILGRPVKPGDDI